MNELILNKKEDYTFFMGRVKETYIYIYIHTVIAAG